jgi:hypothetical protein
MIDHDTLVHCAPDFTVDATFSNLSGTTYNANWPFNNLYDPILKAVARTTTASTVRIGITLDQPEIVGVVCVANHNLSTAAKWSVTVYNDASKTTVRDSSGLIWVWPRVYSLGNRVWGHNNFWRGEIEEKQRTKFTHLATYFLTESSKSSYIEIEIQDSGNAAGYLQFGRLFVASVMQPEFNPDYGALTYYFEDKTEYDEASDGTPYFFNRAIKRGVRYDLQSLSVDEAFGHYYFNTLLSGTSGLVLHAHSRVPGVYSYARTFISYPTKPTDIGFPMYDKNSASIELREAF